MDVVPAVNPDTIPFAGPTTATPLLLLVHVPPLEPSVRVIDDPAHTEPEPPIAVGGLTVDTNVVPGFGHDETPFVVIVTLYVPAIGP